MCLSFFSVRRQNVGMLYSKDVELSLFAVRLRGISALLCGEHRQGSSVRGALSTRKTEGMYIYRPEQRHLWQHGSAYGGEAPAAAYARVVAVVGRRPRMPRNNQR